MFLDVRYWRHRSFFACRRWIDDTRPVGMGARFQGLRRHPLSLRSISRDGVATNVSQVQWGLGGIVDRSAECAIDVRTPREAIENAEQQIIEEGGDC
jgi:hypothetical protein